jgi:hypothetical protein
MYVWLLVKPPPPKKKVIDLSFAEIDINNVNLTADGQRTDDK